LSPAAISELKIHENVPSLKYTRMLAAGGSTEALTALPKPLDGFWGGKGRVK